MRVWEALSELDPEGLALRVGKPLRLPDGLSERLPLRDMVVLPDPEGEQVEP